MEHFVEDNATSYPSVVQNEEIWNHQAYLIDLMNLIFVTYSNNYVMLPLYSLETQDFILK